MANNLDQQLIANSSAGRAGQLLEAKRSSLESGASETDEPPRSLREEVLAAKKEKKAQAGKEGLIKEAVSPIRKATSRLLRQAWLNLIDSFGLTFIWINIHAFLSNVLGEKLFCKLGHEWADLAPAGAENNPGLEAAKKRAALVEKMGVGCLNIVLILNLLITLAFIAMILEVVSNPLSSLKSLATFAWKWVSNAVGIK